MVSLDAHMQRFAYEDCIGCSSCSLVAVQQGQLRDDFAIHEQHGHEMGLPCSPQNAR